MSGLHFSEYDENRYLTKQQIEELEQTRDDACPECFTVHKGECY
jgi:hypothetical protein